MSFVSELKRRNVIRVALGYLAAAWLLIQIVETLFPVFELSDTAIRAVVIVLAAGFVPALIGTWVFEWTPTGIVKDHGQRDADDVSRQQRFDRAVMAVLAVAVAYFTVDKFVLDPARDLEREAEVARQATSDALIESFGEKSIVVLPFLNMSDDKDTEYFSDGITEEMLNLLAKIPELRVISRSTSFVFKGQAISATDVARQLGVTYVLEGSVRRAGPLVRITAQLIDGRSDSHLWSDTFDKEFELDRIFIVQDEIAELVASNLEVTLFDRESDLVNPVAYDAASEVRYMQALLDQYDPDNVELIEELIAKGLEADPDYVDLLWAKSRLNTHKSFWGMISREEGTKTREEVHARLRILDPNNPGWPLHEAMVETDRARISQLAAQAYSNAPYDLSIVEGVMRTARLLGDHETAIVLGRYLVDRDPLSGKLHYRLGKAYIEAGRYEEAIPVMGKAGRLGSGNLDPHYQRGLAHLLNGEPAQSLEAFEESWSERISKVGTLLAYYDLDDQEKYDALYAEAWDIQQGAFRSWIASWTGDLDTAFEILEADYSEDPDSLRLVFSLGELVRMQDDPRWYDLMARLGTTEEDLAKVRIDIDLPAGYDAHPK